MPLTDDDPDDRDAPQAIDLDFDDNDADDDTIDCPFCGRVVYADAPHCPYCNQWLEHHSEAGARSRGWFWPIVIAVLIAVILVFWHGLRR